MLVAVLCFGGESVKHEQLCFDRTGAIDSMSALQKKSRFLFVGMFLETFRRVVLVVVNNYLYCKMIGGGDFIGCGS